jgi:hypothetical protein
LIGESNVTEEPLELFKKMGPREIQILSDYLRLWSRSIEELLEKLKDMTPDAGMLAEIFYWRDMARVHEAISVELKQSFVELVVQVLANTPELNPV